MRHDAVLLVDMLLAARKIQRYTMGMQRADFQATELVQSAVIREVQVIGEAARMITSETKSTHSQIAWVGITGMRNRTVHEYFSIDTFILWDTVQNDIPILIEQLERIVPPEDID